MGLKYCFVYTLSRGIAYITYDTNGTPARI